MIPAYPGSEDCPDRTPEEIKADLVRMEKEGQEFNAHMLVKALKAMEEKKYYTPKIEEFHRGFEYEYKSSESWCWFSDSKGEWKSSEFYGGEGAEDEPCEADCIESALQNEYKRYGDVRVKYLDKEDIQSLGWKYIKTGDEFSNAALYFKIRTNEGSTSPDVYDMRFDPHNPGSLTITSWTDGSWGRNERSMQFYIKNKSELKRLMDFIGIRDIFIAKVKG